MWALQFVGMSARALACVRRNSQLPVGAYRELALSHLSLCLEAVLAGRWKAISTIWSRVRSPFSQWMRLRRSSRARLQNHRAARGPYLSDRFQRPTGTHTWDLLVRSHQREGHRDRFSVSLMPPCRTRTTHSIPRLQVVRSSSRISPV